MFSKNAQTVLEKRYLQRDEAGAIVETVDQLFGRVATAVADAEKRWTVDVAFVARIRDEFFQAMIQRRFMPNSPTLMNAGKDRGQLSACFVLPVPDNLEGIFETCKNAALIHKTGGGTGFSFNRLRPAKDRVATTTGVASGPVSFMTVYDAATEAIRQGGTRRGANMGILNVDHPDIEEFISCKRETNKLNNFNISVGITEKFMEAAMRDEDFALVHPRTGKEVRRVSARQLFNRIVENAHATGEPGIIFLDRINAADTLVQALDETGTVIPGTEDIEATNPCGEQPLGPGDACNLGSINLSAYVDQDCREFNWDSLRDMVRLAVRFLDNIVEANFYPLDFISKAALNNRRIGLGIMGWAEALVLLNIPYNSEQALAKAEEVMRFVQNEAHAMSRELAVERGNFPNWKYSTWAENGIPMRNATVTTIAPTGTISIIAGTTSGIEPTFAISFVRRVLGGTELLEVNPLFERTARERGFYSDELMLRIAEEGTIQHIEGIPEDVKRVWVCSHDISCIWHVRMQAAFQKFTDCAVSKTINLPAEAGEDDVRFAYEMAYKLGLKGLTVYRDTSREAQVLNIGKTDPLKKVRSASLVGTVEGPRTEHARAAAAASSISCRSSEDKFSQETAAYIGNATAASRARHNPGCPGCGSSSGFVARFEACFVCRSCGYTKC
jgi:ribonucleoside-diphosphate reductase alpha chain